MADLSDRLNAALAGRYSIQRELGSGGMAVVFLAEDLRHRRQVALKVLRPELAAEIGSERFLREIEVAARLTHPHILSVHDSGDAGGFLYYVMPYVEGESLRERLAREKQLPLDDALRISREVADALSYAHSRGVFHRDIKPENILLGSGHAVVADFGIARAVTAAGGVTLTAVGMVLGTPAYMSPEQAAHGPDVDGRSDLYSLGCVLYEMLAGKPPFTGPTVESLVHQHQAAEAPSVTAIRPAVPSWVATAIQRALAKTPADRFSPVALFAEALAPREPFAALATPAGVTPAPSRTSPLTVVAVLPFQNLSAEEHSYFAGGLHQELLTQLAKVASLKVISSTSVMGYKGSTKPLKQIAGELGAGSVVEGSVQVAGARLRVNVQLIDAATDEHLWAERYDRTLDDAFAIQSDVAQCVVAAVGAALTRDERASIAAAPTTNAEAYRFYLQGVEYDSRPGFLRQNIEIAQRFFERALELDPGFALAHAALSMTHGEIYWWGYDPRPARAVSQRAEAEAALRLAPDLPQAHLAMGLVHYRGPRDYRAALNEFTIALARLPNDANVWLLVAAARRRLGEWDEMFAANERAQQLDPRDANLVYDMGGASYRHLRRYPEAIREYDRALNLAPDLLVAAVERGWTYFEWQGRLDMIRTVLRDAPAGAELGPFGDVTCQRVALRLLERDADGLLQMLQTEPREVFVEQEGFTPKALYAAWAHQLRGDRAASQAAFDASLGVANSALHAQPNNWSVHAACGLALAGLGRRDPALDEARWLEESDVYRRSTYDGANPAIARVMIVAHLADADEAVDEIERLLGQPGYLTIHALRLDPRWDPIREHPRFQALLAKDAHERSLT